MFQPSFCQLDGLVSSTAELRQLVSPGHFSRKAPLLEICAFLSLQVGKGWNGSSDAAHCTLKSVALLREICDHLLAFWLVVHTSN